MKRPAYFAVSALLAAALSAVPGCTFLKSSRGDFEPSSALISVSPPSSVGPVNESFGIAEAGVSVPESASSSSESEITGLRCSVRSGSLRITEGENFHVSDPSGNSCGAYTEDGIYIVDEDAASESYITVTVPADFQFETVELTAEGGALTAENISTRNLLTSCDKGSITYSGSVGAYTEVQQHQGQTVLNLSGAQSNYNYQLEVDLGSIRIGEDRYAGRHRQQDIDNGAEKTITAGCSMGRVRIFFSGTSSLPLS